MDAVREDEEGEKDELKGGEGSVCGDDNGSGRAWGEYGVEEVGEKCRHDVKGQCSNLL